MSSSIASLFRRRRRLLWLLLPVNRSELGGTGAFNFYVRTLQGDYAVGHFDDAPDGGVWGYTLSGGVAAPPTTTTTTTSTVAAVTAPTIAALVVPAASLLPKA